MRLTIEHLTADLAEVIRRPSLCDRLRGHRTEMRLVERLSNGRWIYATGEPINDAHVNAELDRVRREAITEHDNVKRKP